MKCGFCLVEFAEVKVHVWLGDGDMDGRWAIEYYHCPKCNRYNMFLRQFVANPAGMFAVEPRTRIRPKGSGRPPCPPEVPKDIADDYTEACLVLPDSAKASAALSRRCLQNLLRDKDAAGVKPGDLSKEIQQVLDSGTLPSSLAEAIDAIRNIGNFAAHPNKSTNTGEILPVEPQEAEWNLEVLEELFDHYYVKPERIKARRAKLDAKLIEAGKPPMK